MRKVSLPGIEREVSRMCLGTVNFGVTLDQDGVCHRLEDFFSMGGNFIDTAHVYSNWLPGTTSRSEKMLGKALKAYDRSRWIISTKGAHFDFACPDISRVTPENIVKDLTESLDHLETDYVDLYFLHRDNPKVPVSELVDCLDEQVRNGWIRAIGCSNWTLPRVKEAVAYSMQNRKARFTVNQLMWSMAAINRSGIPSDYVLMDDETMRFSEESRMGIMAYTSLAKGYFTKRWRQDKLNKDLLSTYQNEENDRIFEKIRTFGSAPEVTRYSLRFFEKAPVPAVPIVTCNTREQLLECVSAFDTGNDAFSPI